MSVERYRTRRNQIAIWSFGLFIVAISFVVAVGTGPIWAHIAGLIGLLVGIAYIRRGIAIGIDIRGESILVRGPFRSQRVRAREIVGVETKLWFANPVVRLVTHDGRRFDTNLIQGARTTCPAGHTMDVLRTLQKRLELPTPEVAGPKKQHPDVPRHGADFATKREAS